MVVVEVVLDVVVEVEVDVVTSTVVVVSSEADETVPHADTTKRPPRIKSRALMAKVYPCHRIGLLAWPRTSAVIRNSCTVQS